MLSQLQAAWGARRVLIVGGADRPCHFMQALLTQLGARPARIPAHADALMLNRALTGGRISAVIVPAAHALAPGGVLSQLSALITLLNEVREAGVPLVMLLSDAAVCRAGAYPRPAQEDDSIGGDTSDGLIQSVLQLYADGVRRGLDGDAVSTLIVRHMPCLGCGHPLTAQYSAWCRALEQGEPIPVAHPGMQGVFVHPLDVSSGALLLGARFLSGDTSLTGVYHLGAPPENLIANRTAALRFIREHGGTRPIHETEPPHSAPLPLLDGARARLLCGARCLLPAGEALSMLLALERAAPQGAEAELSVIAQQTENYLKKICGL